MAVVIDLCANQKTICILQYMSTLTSYGMRVVGTSTITSRKHHRCTVLQRVRSIIGHINNNMEFSLKNKRVLLSLSTDQNNLVAILSVLPSSWKIRKMIMRQ